MAGQFACPQTSLFGRLKWFELLLVLCQGDVAEDSGHNHVEVVGNTAGEFAEGFHPVAGDDLLRSSAHFRGVPKHKGGAKEVVALVVDHLAGKRNGALGSVGKRERIMVADRNRFAQGQNLVDQSIGTLSSYAVEAVEYLREFLAFSCIPVGFR